MLSLHIIVVSRVEAGRQMAQPFRARQAAGNGQLMNSGASLQRLERCLSERLEIARSQLDERNDEGLLNSLPGGPVPYMIICAAWSIILLVLLGFLDLECLDLALRVLGQG